MTAMLLEHFHGAVTRVGADRHGGTASRRRLEPPDPLGLAGPGRHGRQHGVDPGDFAALRPQFGAGRWLNYLGDDQVDDAVRAAYGPNYERLVEVKRRYDPDNVFHLNHNIAP